MDGSRQLRHLIVRSITVLIVDSEKCAKLCIDFSISGEKISLV
jgi:hypothetical protein